MDLKAIDVKDMLISEINDVINACRDELSTTRSEKQIRAKLLGNAPPEETERYILLQTTLRKAERRFDVLKREEERKRIKREEEAYFAKLAEEEKNKVYPPPILGPRFFIEGEMINADGHSWKVISYDPEGDLVIECLKIPDDKYWHRYLDKGKQYTLFEHKHNRGSGAYPMEIWEIPGKQMRRNVSQALLYLWDTGPSIELDF